MEVLDLLEELKNLLIDSKELPFVKKTVVNTEEILELLDEIKHKVPDELKQARWITEERTRIIQEAKKEAEDIQREAEKRIIEMVDEHEITKQAEEKSLRIIEDAKIQSREIGESTIDYADLRLEEAEKSIIDVIAKFKNQEEFLETALNRIRQDRKDLKRN